MDSLLQAIMNTGGMPPTDIQNRNPSEQGDTGLGAIDYPTGRMQLSPQLLGTPLFHQVLMHELAHLLQSRTQGMNNLNPTDMAIRQKVGASMADPEMQGSLSENLAQMMEPRQARQGQQVTNDPLLFMVLRSMMNNILGQGLRR